MTRPALARVWGLGLALALAAGGCAAPEDPSPPRASPPSSATAGAGSSAAPGDGARPAAGPLAGRVVVLDPGHQLGNSRFPDEINRSVDAGGFTKPCNTTGTASDAGYPEATVTWEVARWVRRGLERLGARVVLTRTTNSEQEWGPCVDRRGRAGNRVGADLKLSIHADGSYAAGARGFHVIVPGARRPEGLARHRRSVEVARAVRDALVAGGFETATYVGDAGVDVRDDLATLNLSAMPAVMVELGNLRAASDAAVLTSPRGQRRYGVALVRAVHEVLR